MKINFPNAYYRISDMHKYTYRCNKFHGWKVNIGLLVLPALFLFLSACDKDRNPVPPSLTLASGTDYTPSGAVITTGGKIRVGITAEGSDANITNLVVKKIMPDGSVKVVFDSGLNSPAFSVNKTFYQGAEDEARWTVQVMDRNRQFATSAITIFRDPASQWGAILEFPSITMGYQNNTAAGQFLIPSAGKILQADSATLVAGLIDIITYYYVDDEPSPTLSSAGETGGGITEYYPSIAQWSVKNYTKWDISVDSDPIPVAAFDACHNDSLLLLSYDDVWGKRKFKWAEPGDVIPFLTASGKKGLVRILSADHDPAGTISFSLKIQP